MRYLGLTAFSCLVYSKHITAHGWLALSHLQPRNSDDCHVAWTDQSTEPGMANHSEMLSLRAYRAGGVAQHAIGQASQALIRQPVIRGGAGNLQLPPRPARIHVPQRLIPAILITNLFTPMELCLYGFTDNSRPYAYVILQHCTDSGQESLLPLHTGQDCPTMAIVQFLSCGAPADSPASRLPGSMGTTGRQRRADLAAVVGVHAARLLLSPAPVEAPAPGRLPQRVLVLRQRVRAAP